MSESERALQEHAASLMADALGEDYVDEKCCECGQPALVLIDNILKCDICGNQQLPSANRPN